MEHIILTLTILCKVVYKRVLHSIIEVMLFVSALDLAL